jgi:hypothetical protein
VLIQAVGTLASLLLYDFALRRFGFDTELLRAGSGYWGPGRWLGIMGMLLIFLAWGSIAKRLRSRL